MWAAYLALATLTVFGNAVGLGTSAEITLTLLILAMVHLEAQRTRALIVERRGGSS